MTRACLLACYADVLQRQSSQWRIPLSLPQQALRKIVLAQNYLCLLSRRRPETKTKLMVNHRCGRQVNVAQIPPSIVWFVEIYGSTGFMLTHYDGRNALQCSFFTSAFGVIISQWHFSTSLPICALDDYWTTHCKPLRKDSCISTQLVLRDHFKNAFPP